MFKPQFLLWPLLPALLVTGCAGDERAGNRAAADSALTNASSDPALNTALRSPIMTDPDLKADANTYAVRPAEHPVEGGVPPVGTGAPAKSPAAAMPAAREMEGGASAPRTLAGVARTGASGACADQLDYGMAWADRLPAAFALYPGANLMEAAGNGRTGCNLRVVRFVVPDGVEAAIGYYYQRAQRAGYTSDHQADGDIHILAGNRRDGAHYRIRATPHHGGGTDIDLVTS
jgi:hypothetical protein